METKLNTRTTEDRIIYQNQSHLTQKWFESCGVCPELEDLVRVTDLLVLYVKHGKSETLTKSFETAQKYITDKYKK